jgi:hypothetical protein
MPDTGAPWNIPYVAPADLVRDYPVADEAQALAIAAGLTSANSVIRQVLQTVMTDTFSTTSTSYVDVTGLTVTITPTSATSKVLLIASVALNYNNSDSDFGSVTLFSGSTNLAVPDSPGSRTAALSHNVRVVSTAHMMATHMTFLDSPGVATPVTYSVRVLRSGSAGTIFVNRSSADTNAANHPRGVSTITAIEVAP